MLENRVGWFLSIFLVILQLLDSKKVFCQVLVKESIPDQYIRSADNVHSNFTLNIPASTFSSDTTVFLSLDNSPSWISTSLHVSDLVGLYNSPGSGSFVYSDSKIYTCDNDFGLQIINVANPEEPEFIGSEDFGGSGINDIVLFNQTAYVFESGGICAVDVSTPNSPSTVCMLDGISPRRAVIDENRNLIFVADSEFGLRILSTCGEGPISQISSQGTSGSRSDLYLDEEENIVYFADGDFLLVFDVSNEYSPTVVFEFETASPVYSVLKASDDKVLFLSTEEELLTLDVEDPTEPQSLGGLVWPSSSKVEDETLSSTYGHSAGLYQEGTKYLYAYGTYLDEFLVIDVSSFPYPELITLSYSTSFSSTTTTNNSSIQGLYVEENQLYVSNTSGIYIYDFGDFLLLEQNSPAGCGFHEELIVFGTDIFGSSNSTSFIFSIQMCSCYGVLATNQSACVFGECVLNDTCICYPNYYGKTCEITSCYSLLSNDTRNPPCSNTSGICVEHDDCECQYHLSNGRILPLGEKIYEYFGLECEHTTTCYNVSILETDPPACSGHGICNIDGTCTCSEGYEGDECEIWTCYNYTNIEVGEVCGGHGFCFESDLCLCQEGYFPPPDLPLGPCLVYFCGEHQFDEYSDVCSGGRGTCVSSGNCFCHEGYEGENCETWSCGYPKDSSLTCRGMGDCVSPDECDCNTGFTGVHCGSMTGGAIAGIVIPTVFVGISFFCCLFCAVCLFSCLGVVSCISCCVCVSLYIFQQSRSLSRFSKLRNIDILLNEQRLEEDTSMANLRIKKHLYQIPFDELMIDKMLGEGGSQGLVFKVDWKGRTVALKCFKTRLVCANQNKFDEFESEVEVLSSLKHPYIIQFFGATMKPPRVGIVMEYCEKGDMVAFFKNHQTYFLKEYPLKQKLRMLHEIALSMAYIHSRRILHRDLKLENVLVTEKEETRLMDFGLSKIVDRMSQVRTSRIGTHIYMSPEVILSQSGYNEKVDVYSYSILVYITLTEIYHPYGEKIMMVELKVANDPNYRPDISKLESKIMGNNNEMKWVRDLVVRNWNASPTNRNSFPEIADIFEKFNGALGIEPETKSEEESLVYAEQPEIEIDAKNYEMEDMKTLEKDFEGNEKNFYFYVKQEVDRMKNIISQLKDK